MVADWHWAIIAVLAYGFGLTSGIAWAAQWRPTRIEVRISTDEPPA